MKNFKFITIKYIFNKFKNVEKVYNNNTLFFEYNFFKNYKTDQINYKENFSYN